MKGYIPRLGHMGNAQKILADSLLTNHLSNFMELSTVTQTTQEFAYVLCNPSLIPILCQMNPVHTLPSYLSKINVDGILTYV
jgi:hypothetical protein